MSVHYLFVDMNSYFASVEQHLRPHLRGKPVAVVPIMADTTCCISASYEAQAYGVKTGTPVYEARRLCPQIALFPSRTHAYVDYSQRVVKAVESVIPVHKTLSIDEMSCRLMNGQTSVSEAVSIARAVKQAIKTQVGESLRCSVGLSSNGLLAKLASDMQKPDGLTVILKEDLPSRLFSLELNSFPGIGRNMLRRFQREGIFTVQQMYQLSPEQLKQIWGGVLGQRWWHLIRGEDLPEKPTQTRSVSHSHVLPPEYRTDELAYGVLVKLVHKAAVRLRAMKYWAGTLSVHVSYRNYSSWGETVKLGNIQDTPSMLAVLAEIWEKRPQQACPLKVDVTLGHLKSAASCSLPLFPEQRRRGRVVQAMDAINQKFGEGALYLAAMHDTIDAAPDRIAFQSIPECRPSHPRTNSA